ncbi:hypothetical protein CRV24_009557 [Beauveria bassiana]|nr:hypothetical protein CRV24_009557 [Beauveria bassiana]
MCSTPNHLWGSESVTREGLLQKITLLTLLAPVQEPPRTHELFGHQQRTLTIYQEAEIASNLAFLSRRSADSQNVAAIGLEEKEDGQGITVRVAVNGNRLGSVVEGLTCICNVIQSLVHNGALLSVNIDLLLEEVVRLNIPRLKSRLKVRKKHNIDLSPIPQLVKICRDINVDAEANRVLLALEMLTRVFKEASSSPPTQATYQTAANIVKLAFELTATNVLEVVDRCAAERHNVARYTDTVRKLGQYFRATKQLVLAATSSRGSRLFRHLQVCAFQIEVPCCIREQGCSNSGTAAVQAACSPVARRNLRQRFHCSEEAIESRVKEKLDKAKPGMKVHAEIQLLFFYECHEIRQPPRLIAAT